MWDARLLKEFSLLAYSFYSSLYFFAIFIYSALILPVWCRKFEKIGDFSYGIYLDHYPILQIASLIGIHHFGFIPYFGFALSITVPLSVVSWFYIEKPANSLRHFFSTST